MKTFFLRTARRLRHALLSPVTEMLKPAGLYQGIALAMP
jgi:hypothetical protein